MTSQPVNSNSNNSNVDSNKNQNVVVNHSKQKESEEVKDDFSNVELVYEMTAGYYTAGIDIPSGRCNVTGSGLFCEHIQNIELPKGTELEISGDLKVKMTPSK